MGYNRSGTIRKNRLKRRRRELERLAKKHAAQGQTAGQSQQGAPATTK